MFYKSNESKSTVDLTVDNQLSCQRETLINIISLDFEITKKKIKSWKKNKK